MRAFPGFTLLETLIALAVFGLFLGGLLHAERSYHREVANEDASLRMQQKQAVVELLRAEVGVAGYEHAGDDIWVTSERSTDRLGFVYLEDRVAGVPTHRTVTFDAGVDRSGVASLYRQEGVGYRQPAVLGVEELRVVGWIDRNGRWSVSTETNSHPLPGTLVNSVVLELRFTWDETIRITIGLLNPVSYGIETGG